MKELSETLASVSRMLSGSVSTVPCVGCGKQALSEFQARGAKLCDACIEGEDARRAKEALEVFARNFGIRSKLDPAYRELSFANWIGAVPAAVASWRPPQNLVLFGPAGAGKTHLAVAALRRASCELGLTTLFCPADPNELRFRLIAEDGKENRDVIESFSSTGILLVDDLNRTSGQEKGSYAEEMLETILDRRHRRQLATIITTNRAPRTLYEGDRDAGVSGNPRVWSRILAGAALQKLDPQSDRRIKPIRK